MEPDFGDHHHHLYHHHPGFGGLHEGFEWLPVLAGAFVTVAVAWMLLILLSGDRLEPTLRAAGLGCVQDPVRKRWHDAMNSHAATAREFAAYECDLAAVLRHPDLADVTRPATALFIDAFVEANALATERYPGVEHAERFTRAAQRGQRAWRAAVDAAQPSRVASFASGERVLLNQLLAPRTVATDSAHESEQRSAHQPPSGRLVELERRTNWIPATGRHRAHPAGPRHAANGRQIQPVKACASTSSVTSSEGSSVVNLTGLSLTSKATMAK